MFIKYRPTNLGQKTALFVLVPTLLILSISGIITMRIAKEVIVEQWVDKTNSILKSSAGIIEKRLEHPKQLIELIQLSPPNSYGAITRGYLLKHLEQIPGVLDVNRRWPSNLGFTPPVPKHPTERLEELQKLYKGHEPYYTAHNLDAPLKDQYLTLHADLLDPKGETRGGIDVKISFSELLGDISKSSWWNLAFMLDAKGKSFGYDRSTTKDRLVERHIFNQMQENPFGTIFAEGFPPKEVCIFYNLNEAPWTLIVVGSGSSLMQPLIQFRNIFLTITIGATLTILCTIHIVTSKINCDINKVSQAARRLAKGEFGEEIPVTSKDEIGSLCKDFNTMTSHLKEGVQLQKSMEIAREVQQNLLPKERYLFGNVEIAGECIYCDATGGDFYDVVPCHDKKQVSLVVGDVVGHGIGAALLMTTTRALLRSKLGCDAAIAGITSEVNTLLCRDTVRVHNFVTLFLARIDYTERKMTWVRAGHEPSLAYTPKTKTLHQLKGKGLPLGIESEFSYVEQEFELPNEETIILLATDGIYESQNSRGEQFGKQRIEELLIQYAELAAHEIMDKISSAIQEFLGEASQEDDITLMVVKIPQGHGK